jgi:hypothetical protein
VSWRRIAALAAFAVAVSAARGAEAITLRFTVPPDCDPRADIAEDVEQLVGRPLASVDAEFAVAISASARGGYELVLTSPKATAREAAVRRLYADSCTEIGNATALTIAMAIGLGPEASPPNEQTEPQEFEPAEPSRTMAPDTASPAPVAPVPAVPKPFAVVGLSAMLDTGALPTLAPGLELELGIGWRSLRAFALGAVLAPQRAAVNARGGDFQLMFGGLAACIERGTNVLVRGCAGFELGRLTGEGVGVLDPHLGSALWLGPRAELAAGLPIADGLVVMAGLGAVFALGERSFVLEPGEEVHRAALLDGRGRLGLEFRP